MRTSRRDLLTGMPAVLAAAAGADTASPVVRLPRKIRVALLGLEGHTGEVLGPLKQLPDVEVVAYYDQEPSLVQRFSRNAALAKGRSYSDARQMLDKEQLDVVGVCNRNHEHAQAILECMGRGLHVIAEKPIATEFKDLERIRAAVEKGPARLTSMHPMRYSAPYKALKKIVDSGEIGEVVQMDAQKSYKVGNRLPWWYQRETYGGTLPWIGIHMVDLMLFTSGRDLVEAATFQNHIGFPETGDTENVTGTVFRMDNGGVALLRMDYLRPQKAVTHGDDRLRLAGTKGIAEYMAATGVTVVSNARAQEVVRDLPAEGSLFVEFLDWIYNNKPMSLSWKEIYRGHQIVLGAREAGEKHRIVKL
ncbi:MAG: Gfo/Idh/MocA family oxidoreductase [Acidimicrobiia bacterium]|nr:Gfo/Idh/MocA family oxidoreductase [Acidimicrobiia bacterium]